ncbi:MAG TPA: 4-hydroxy-tetrahydrodipicolinate synthase [Chitinophagaceae bacterium]|nr:4-hydroxy-tetrahydrodipicolinate synthase [Chitinophagaceae bacterium]
MNQKLQGLGVALVTPFNEELSVDESALTRVVNHVIDGGADFLVVLGTTSEAPTMSMEEKKLVLKTVVETNDGKLPIVLGLGGNNTQELLADIESYDLKGVDAFLSVVPYYNKPTQEGLAAHFSALSKASPLPIILYNVPGRTVTNMLPHTTVNLGKEHKNIIGIKEASGNIAQGMKIVQNAPADFLILSGDDDLVMPQVAAGFHGVISVVGNAYPKLFKDMITAIKAGDLEKGKAIHYQLLTLIDMLFEEGNPAGVKAVLTEMGIAQSFVRLPLLPASSGLKNRLKEEMATISH